MEEDDEINSLENLMKLISQYPDLSNSIIADVLQQCQQDHHKAYEVICEMVIPPDASATALSTSPTAEPPSQDGPVAPTRKDAGVPVDVRYAYPHGTEAISEFHADLLSTAPQAYCVNSEGEAQGTPSASPNAALRGAWARKSMGRTYRVDQLCKRYQWLERSTIEVLCEKYGDCCELVENDILAMYPVDQPEAFNGGEDPPFSAPRVPSIAGTSLQGSTAPQQSPHQRAIAESLRQQDAAQIQQDSLTQERISLSSRNMATLRQELWDVRQTRMRMQQLANQTRKPIHVTQAKNKDNELQRLSASFLARMRRSEEYRNGCIDLHGLTKEEALQLIVWKLEDSGSRRFRVITGRGTHSLNGQAVLRPALERYFRSKGISFSMVGDGIMNVVP